jgi:hypothetical protein
MDKQIAPFSPPGPLDKSTFGGLSLRQEVLDGFMSIRDQHHQLQGILHQTMRRVVLPRAREIGQALEKVKSYYEPAKKGPGGKASAFYTDCKVVAGLGKTQAAGYIRIATEWHRLIDYMADLPEGADPVLSLGAALKAIAIMNSAPRPALPGTDCAVDVDATTVATTDGEGTRPAPTSYARSTREKTVQALEALLATAPGRRHEERIRKVIEAVELLLQTIEEEEAAAAPAEEWSEVEPVEEIAPPQPRSYSHPQAAPAPAATPAPAPLLEEPAPAEGAVSLVSLFPLSTPEESFAAMTDLVVEHGNGAAVAASLGCALSSFKNHKSRLKKLLEQAQEQGQG